MKNGSPDYTSLFASLTPGALNHLTPAEREEWDRLTAEVKPVAHERLIRWLEGGGPRGPEAAKFYRETVASFIDQKLAADPGCAAYALAGMEFPDFNDQVLNVLMFYQQAERVAE